MIPPGPTAGFWSNPLELHRSAHPQLLSHPPFIPRSTTHRGSRGACRRQTLANLPTLMRHPAFDVARRADQVVLQAHLRQAPVAGLTQPVATDQFALRAFDGVALMHALFECIGLLVPPPLLQVFVVLCPEGLADCYTVTATPVGGGTPTVFNVTGTPCNWVQPAPVFGISQELTLVDAGGGNPCGWQFSWATGFATYYLTKYTGSDPTGDYPGSAGGFTISISACP